MKQSLLYMLVIIVALISCGASDSPDSPADVVIGVVSNPLDPTKHIKEYFVHFFKVDSIPASIPDSCRAFITSGGRMSMQFTAPAKFTEVDTTAEPGSPFMYKVQNEDVGYTQIDDLWKAYFEFTVYADAGYYEIRVKAIGTNRKHGKLSAAGKNYVEVQ